MKLLSLALLPLVISAAETRTPVIVELFTSEGCSSCPAADQLLADIERTQPVPSANVLVLSEHVDYWNRLGWRDPFSSREFSARQSAYADAFHHDGVYTPQMVVDGKAEFVGSNSANAKAAISAAAARPKAEVAVTGSGKLMVNVSSIPGGVDSDVYLAVTERNLKTDVRRGENSGRTLHHTGVVRRLTLLGKSQGGFFSAQVTPELAAEWNRANLQAVVFVQSHTTKEILGAATAGL